MALTDSFTFINVFIGFARPFAGAYVKFRNYSLILVMDCFTIDETAKKERELLHFGPNLVRVHFNMWDCYNSARCVCNMSNDQFNC